MIKEKRFLITTALEQTWAEDRPVLFLGEWCRRYSRKSHWSSMKAIVQQHHWDDREKFYADYIYLNHLYERVLEGLSVKLNQIHGVDFSLRYWRILVGPWLASFIHIVFDRWTSIKNAVNGYDITGTIAIHQQLALVPNDMNEFISLFLGDEWNHFIYTEILSEIGNLPITFINTKVNFLNNKPVKNKKRISGLLIQISSRIANFFVRNDDAFISSTYLTKYDEALLHLRLLQFPQFGLKLTPSISNLDFQQRDWRASVKCKNDFEVFLLSIIPKQIPKVYIEGYKELLIKTESTPWPKLPKLIYTANILWHDEVSMLYTAEKVEQGTRLIYGQHGGGYGTAKFHFAEEHEVAISDRYLTWGWNSPKLKKIVPIGAFKAPNKISRKFNRKTTLLCISLGIPRYTFRLCAESAINYQSYIDRNFAFVSQLKDDVLSEFLLRLAPEDYGQDTFLRWNQRFPALKIDRGGKKIKSLMSDARIVVQTYNQTGLLESLALGIPSVLFCELNVTPLRETATPFYAELKRVGILHESSESAALHVNNVWNDVDAWWGSDEVQSVVASFKKQYCHQPENILDEIESILQEVFADLSSKKNEMDKL